ncbi:MAG: uroporphyrinogen-III synthase, partial [Anaerolineae bacterium]|nr:uroporphyrinogen-III synthase [Anaerolineae bacterium]MDW8071620.1 uroporphyrinogen-III synthase [Anaerolineae bacterium]
MTKGLAGLRVVITRPETQSETLSERLRRAGAVPILFPVITIAPPEPGGALDQALRHLPEYHWIIFTSVNGVQQFCYRLADIERMSSPQSQGIPEFRGKIAAIGPKTAETLRQFGIAVDVVPREYRAEAILDVLGDVRNMRILLPRADIARAELARGLRERGASVDEVVAYRTLPATPPPHAFAQLRQGVDVVTFTSSSTVRHFVALTRGIDYGDPAIACIGPVTAETARQLGLRVDIVAEE